MSHISTKSGMNSPLQNLGLTRISPTGTRCCLGAGVRGPVPVGRILVQVRNSASPNPARFWARPRSDFRSVLATHIELWSPGAAPPRCIPKAGHGSIGVGGELAPAPDAPPPCSQPGDGPPHLLGPGPVEARRHASALRLREPHRRTVGLDAAGLRSGPKASDAGRPREALGVRASQIRRFLCREPRTLFHLRSCVGPCGRRVGDIRASFAAGGQGLGAGERSYDAATSAIRPPRKGALRNNRVPCNLGTEG